MNKNIQNPKTKTATTNIQSKIQLKFKHLVCFALSFSFLLFGAFSNITAQAAPITDAVLTGSYWSCTRLANVSNRFDCILFNNVNNYTFPADLKLGVGTTPSGICTTIPGYISCSNIPVTTTNGDTTLNYSGTGLVGGSTVNTIRVVPLVTVAQDLAAIKNCPNTRANISVAVCTFQIPIDTVLPDHYRLNVEETISGSACEQIYFPTISCSGLRTGSITGTRNILSNIIDNGVPVFSGSTINIAPYFTAADESLINLTCNYVLIGTESYCSGTLPANRSVPQNYKLGIGVNPNSSLCYDLEFFAGFYCNNVPTSQIPGSNTINTSLSPLGSTLRADLYRYFDAIEDLTIPRTCETANTLDTTTCLFETLPQFRKMDPSYRLGVGTNPGGECYDTSNVYAPRVYCNLVPTGNIPGSNVRINSNLNTSGTGSTSVLDNSTCLTVPNFYPNTASNLNIFDILKPIQASASGHNCCEVPGPPADYTVYNSINPFKIFNPIKVNATPSSPEGCNLTTTSGKGTITISNQTSSNSTQNSSSSSKPSISLIQNSYDSSNSTIAITETATTQIYNPDKLKNGKTRPNNGVLSNSDDKESIADPYLCGGDIHGVVEYSGDYNNLKVVVKALNLNTNIIYDIPNILDVNSYLYVAKVDYDKIPQANYKVTYSVDSKVSGKVLDQHDYFAFITKNCGSENIENITLARTGGKSNLTNISFILAFILGVAGITSFGKDNNKLIKNQIVVHTQKNLSLKK